MGEHLASVGLTPLPESQQRQNSEEYLEELFSRDADFLSQFEIDPQLDIFDLTQDDIERFAPPACPDAYYRATHGKPTVYEAQPSTRAEHPKRPREDAGPALPPGLDQGNLNDEQGSAKRRCLHPPVSSAPDDRPLYSGTHELATQDSAPQLGRQSNVVQENSTVTSTRSSEPFQFSGSTDYVRPVTSGAQEKDIHGVVGAHSHTNLRSVESASRETQNQPVSLPADPLSGLRTPITDPQNTSADEKEDLRFKRKPPDTAIRVISPEGSSAGEEAPSRSEQEPSRDPLINKHSSGTNADKPAEHRALTDPAANASGRPENRPAQPPGSQVEPKDPASKTLLNNFGLLPQGLLASRIRESVEARPTPPKHLSAYPTFGGPLGYIPSSPALHVRCVKVAPEEVVEADKKQKKRIQHLTYERDKYMAAYAKSNSVNPSTGTTAEQEDNKQLKRSLAAKDRKLSKAEQNFEDLRQQKEELESTVRRLRGACYEHGLLPSPRPSDQTPMTGTFHSAAPPGPYPAHIRSTGWPPAGHSAPVYASAPANGAFNQQPVSHTGPAFPYSNLPYSSPRYPGVPYAVPYTVPGTAAPAPPNAHPGTPHYHPSQLGDYPARAYPYHVANSNPVPVKLPMNPNVSPIAGTFAIQPGPQTAHHPAGVPADQPTPVPVHQPMNPNVSRIAGTFASQPGPQTAHHPAGVAADRPIPVSAPPTRPMTWVSSAKNVVDLTVQEDKTTQGPASVPVQSQASQPAPQQPPAPGPNANPDFRVTMRRKEMSWLGDRNHVKQGYMQGPPINPEVMAANKLAEEEAQRVRNTPSVQARQSQPDPSGHRGAVAPAAETLAAELEPVRQAGSSGIPDAPEMDGFDELQKQLEEALTEEALKTDNK